VFHDLPQWQSKFQIIVQKGHDPHPPVIETFSKSDFPPSCRGLQLKRSQLPGFNPQASIQPKFVSQRTNLPEGSTSPPPVVIALSMDTSRPSAKTLKHVSLSTSPVIAHKSLFFNSSYAFRTQEWSKSARIVVFSEAKDSALS
jgi:hypothetical protein